MCCGSENLALENTTDVKRLISSVLRKRRINRVRKHPSMCVDAILASTLKVLKNDLQLELTTMASQQRGRKRPMHSQETQRKKKSRWDVKYKIKNSSDDTGVDEEMEDLLGMNRFFQKLKEISSYPSSQTGPGFSGDEEAGATGSYVTGDSKCS